MDEKGGNVGILIDAKEHSEILADIGILKHEVHDEKETLKVLTGRLDTLEDRAKDNLYEHKSFVKIESLQAIQDSLRKLENSVVIMSPKQAKEGGVSLFQLLAKNPTLLLWVILALIILLMIIMGYSIAEISSVLNGIQ